MLDRDRNARRERAHFDRRDLGVSGRRLNWRNTFCRLRVFGLGGRFNHTRGFRVRRGLDRQLGGGGRNGGGRLRTGFLGTGRFGGAGRSGSRSCNACVRVPCCRRRFRCSLRWRLFGRNRCSGRLAREPRDRSTCSISVNRNQRSLDLLDEPAHASGRDAACACAECGRRARRGPEQLAQDLPNAAFCSAGLFGSVGATCHAIEFGPAPVTPSACTSPCPRRGPAVPSRFRSSQSSRCPRSPLQVPFRFLRCPTPLRRARVRRCAASRA